MGHPTPSLLQHCPAQARREPRSPKTPQLFAQISSSARGQDIDFLGKPNGSTDHNIPFYETVVIESK